MRIPVAKEVLKLALPLAILCLVLLKIHILLSGVVFVFLISTLLFFRDPVRSVSVDESHVLAPADGTVVQIQEVFEENERCMLISIFMSVLNVHINYAPLPGRVVDVTHRKGSFLRAHLKEASLQNESNTLVLEYGSVRMKMKQIAGLIARRIVCYSKRGDALTHGQKIGLIQFGSRVDLYLPRSVELRVKKGDKVKGAQTVLGVLFP
ncbi:MAG: phosphatidylserine decarboxylase family protein [Chlamydiae bacterium]|nr:phosphatidylserine decarboxylase family protein [Chlamydiota bacterium]MBI3267286.1 phosphatidylserine decarboxylase family protein [Chlamydiota bacterium]